MCFFKKLGKDQTGCRNQGLNADTHDGISLRAFDDCFVRVTCLNLDDLGVPWHHLQILLLDHLQMKSLFCVVWVSCFSIFIAKVVLQLFFFAQFLFKFCIDISGVD